MVTNCVAGYSERMNVKRIFSQTNTVRLGLAILTLGIATGCVARWDGPRAGTYVEPEAFVAQDDYVYYPNYECYYSVSRHQYAYREGNIWVARPAPRGVSVNVLVTSPSVKMNFHDSPALHHDVVAKQYPKNWKPAGEARGQNQKDDQHREGNDR